ncbi:restriction endonuclease [Ktedonobacteria bacterium brp13]|nr:restriction endonuclease [Ktedonobacteria bacterium brp13]
MVSWQQQQQALLQQATEQIRQYDEQKEQIRQKLIQENEQKIRQQILENEMRQQILERERIARLKSLNDILVLTPREFEKLTGKILEQIGGLHNVQHVGGSGDLGADLIGLDSHNEKVIIQCKRYAPGNMIGSPSIQTFIGMIHVHHKVQKGIFVTTSKFTQPAIDLANKHNISLIDGDDIVKFVQAIQTNKQSQ